MLCRTAKCKGLGSNGSLFPFWSGRLGGPRGLPLKIASIKIEKRKRLIISWSIMQGRGLGSNSKRERVLVCGGLEETSILNWNKEFVF